MALTRPKFGQIDTSSTADTTIGLGATDNFRANNSIILNASGNVQYGNTSGFYVNPIRNDLGNISQAIYYNATTKELTYAAVSSYSNVQVATYLPTDSTITGIQANLVAGNVFVTTSVNNANLALKGYVDAQNTAGNVFVTTSVNTANIGMIGYVNNQVNAANVAWQANALAQQAQINSLSGGSYSNVQVATYLPTYTGNVQASNVYTSTLTVSSTNLALGLEAGRTTQGNAAIAIGEFAGTTTQGDLAVAIGYQAGGVSQNQYAIACGYMAGQLNQQEQAIAIGIEVGQINQGGRAIAIGSAAGYSAQGNTAIAIGRSAGSDTQGISAIACGYSAGQVTQGNYSVAIGHNAGTTNQGIYSVAIGYGAGENFQANNSIILNASGNVQYGNIPGFYVNPIRNDTGNITQAVYFNPTTHELTYDTVAGSYGDAQVASYLPTDSTIIGIQENLIAGNVFATSSVNTANIGMIGYVGQQVTTANVGMKGYVDSLVGGGASYGNANVGAYLPTDSTITGIQANLVAGNVFVTTSVNTANIGMIGYVNNQVTTSVTTANIGLKGYVDAQDTAGNVFATSAVTTANIGMIGYVNNQVTTANIGMIGYVNSVGAAGNAFTSNQSIAGNTYALSQVTTANIGMIGYVNNQVTTANLALKGYVDAQDTAGNVFATGAVTTANVGMIGYVGQQVTTANVGMKGYVDAQDTAGNVFATSSVTTANIGMIGYVNSVGAAGNAFTSNQSIAGNTYALSQVTTANIGMIGYVGQQVTTANIGMIGYVNNQVNAANVAWQANALSQQTQISTLFSNRFSLSSSVIYAVDTTLTASNLNGRVRTTTAGLTFTLPALSATTTGDTLSISNLSTGTLSITVNVADTGGIYTPGVEPALTIVLAQKERIILTANGTFWDTLASGVNRGKYTLFGNNGVQDTHIIQDPIGGYDFGTDPTSTGAIKIALPVAALTANNMLSLKVEIWEYAAADKPCHLIINGYRTAAGVWSNTSVQIIGSLISIDYAVRFGNDVSTACIWIGEVSSVWNYLRVRLAEVKVSYNATAINSTSIFDSGWVISTEVLAFDTVSITETANLLIARPIKMAALSITANTTLTAEDAGRQIYTVQSAPITITLPASATANGGIYYSIVNTNSSDVTLAVTDGLIYAFGGDGVTSIILGYGESIEIGVTGTTWIGINENYDRGISCKGLVGHAATATLTAADLGKLVYFQHATVAGTLTLPDSAAIPLHSMITITNANAADCTVQRAGTNTIFAKGGIGVTSILLKTGDTLALCSDGTNWVDAGSSTNALFTSTSNGLVPLSGGGTTNFLRADGTWVNPTVSAYSNVQVATYLPTYTGIVTASYLNSTGNITAGGSLTTAGAINTGAAIATTGILYANSAAASTNTTTGALRVAGGLGVAGNVQTAAIYTNNYFYANGVAFTGGGGGGGSSFSTTDDTATNATYYPTFVTSVAGANAKMSSTKLTFNPSTGTLFSTEFLSSSDERLKANIATIADTLSIVNQLNQVSFNWKENDAKSFGVIAQELEKVIPELVHETEDGFKRVKYDGIVAFLIGAVKELSIRVDALEKK